MNTQCSAITRSGTRCPNRVRTDSDHCFAHDPGLADQRERGRKQGGHGRSNIVRAQKALPKDAQGVADLLLWAMHATANGELHPSILSAVSTGARAYVEVTRGATLEVRFAELEAMLREQAKEGAA